MDTTTRSIIRYAQSRVYYVETLMEILDPEDMAIEKRNELLDEYRRAEQTIESLAEQGKGAR